MKEEGASPYACVCVLQSYLKVEEGGEVEDLFTEPVTMMTPYQVKKPQAQSVSDYHTLVGMHVRLLHQNTFFF